MARFFPFVAGVAVFLLGVATDRMVRHLGHSILLSVADDVFMAVLLGSIVFFYERHRRRYIETRLKVIRDMNHHVRNALQVISYSAARQSDKDVNRMIRDSVTRIDWALREVLPGEEDSNMVDSAASSPAQR